MAKARTKATHKDLEGLPDEVKELVEPHVVTPQMLTAIAVTLVGKREEAKQGRTATNIESTWIASEEAYLGMDDANRLEWSTSKWTKPMSMEGPVQASGFEHGTESNRSTVFVRLTSRYVDAGAAKLAEILLPVDDKAFSLKETPNPDLIKAKDNRSQVVHDETGMPLTRPSTPNELQRLALQQGQGQQPQPGQPPLPPPAQGQPGQPPQPQGQPSQTGQVLPFPAPQGAAQAPIPAAPGGGAPPSTPNQGAPPQPPGQPRQPLTVKDLAEENIERAHKAAKAAEKRIYDWLVESCYAAEIRKVIFDSARLGVGVLKGPFPRTVQAIALSKDKKAGVNVNMVQRVKPAVKWIKPWDFFPDPACGECIHDGDYVFERDYMTEKQVRNLKKERGYIADQIDKCLRIGPKQAAEQNNADPGNREKQKRETRYEVWYYYGTLTKNEINVFKTLGNDSSDVPDDKDLVFAICTMIDDEPVRATINPLDSGAFPYHAMPWQRRTGSWAGVGIPEQLVTPQKMINGATRAMMDNAGISAGPQTVMDMSAIEPADGDWTVTPNKLWYMKRGSAAAPNGVKDAFATFELPNTTDPLMKVVEYSLKLAEESTSIPLITQGQTGVTTPETYGASQLQDTNANQLLRSIGYCFDDYVTEPLIRQYYEWLLLDPDVPDDEKGEYQIEAHGSSALVERAIQDQTIAQMGNMVLNPNYGLDPKRWAKMMLRSKRIHPQDLAYSEKELENLAAQPQPKAPQIEVATINAQVAREKIAASQSSDQRSLQNEMQIAQAANALDSAKVQTEKQKALTEQQYAANEKVRLAEEAKARMAELQTRKEIAMLEHASKRNIALSQVQAELVKETMKLDAAMKMNQLDHAVDAGHRVEERQHALHNAEQDRALEREQSQAERNLEGQRIASERAMEHGHKAADRQLEHHHRTEDRKLEDEHREADREHEAEQADEERKHDMKKHKLTIEEPPVQTPGKAGKGRAFEQGP